MAQLSFVRCFTRMTAEWDQATSSGDAQRVSALIASGADVDALDRHGQTALMNASHKGHAKVVRLLVQRRAKLNHTAKYGLTARMLAVIADHPDVVRLLVDAGADTTVHGNQPQYDMTALELAQRHNRSRCMEILSEATPSI